MTDLNTINIPDAPPAAERIAAGELDAADNFNTYPSAQLPMSVARRLVADLFTTGKHRTLAYWRGDYWTWQRTAWQQVEDELDVKGPLWERLEKVTVSDKEGEEKPWAPTTAKVQNIMEPLAILTRNRDSEDAPMWLDGDDAEHPAADRIVSMNNGLLDLSTRHLAPHTPAYFNTWALDFDFDAAAECPTWTAFLADIFEHDPAGIALLQEFFGYYLTGRTDMHKALLIVGPPRAGKGVISRALKQLIGFNNTVSPSLHSIGSEFGLAELIGKPLAVFEDARADGDHRSNLAVERLLNIIGEDAVSINRKNRDYWNGTLPTRFLLSTNEIPRFLDSSGAITNRFMSVKLEKNFLGREDTSLGARIDTELPGIFNWALAGADRLKSQGKFTRPLTMDEMQDTMKDLSSPLQMFIDDRYEITGDQGDVIALREVFRQYQSWCATEERTAITQETLRQRLNALDSRISVKNTRVNEKKNRWVFGLRVRL